MKIENLKLPSNRVCVKNKWIFKIKWNGIFRAQLAANFMKNGIILVGIYVDDCMMIGSDEDIGEVIKGLKDQDLGLKVEDFLTDYFCKVIMNLEKAEV
jgi:hypothetical protein